MTTSSDIVDLARQFAGPDFQCGDDDNMFRADGLRGEKATQFMDAFTNAYSVDMSGFLHFFHDVEGQGASRTRVTPVGLDGKPFPIIPITPRLLADAAIQQTWPLEYPKHTLRSSRWPLTLMFLILALFVLAVTVLGAGG